jgi:hypothetical protein
MQLAEMARKVRALFRSDLSRRSPFGSGRVTKTVDGGVADSLDGEMVVRDKTAALILDRGWEFGDEGGDNGTGCVACGPDNEAIWNGF